MSTDLSLTAAQIIEIYAACFSLEIAIRDLNFGFESSHGHNSGGNSTALLFASGN